MKQKNIKHKPIGEEGLVIIYEQLRIRRELKLAGYLTWKEVAQKLGLTRAGVYWLIERELSRMESIRKESHHV